MDEIEYKQWLFNKLNASNNWGQAPLFIDNVLGPKSQAAFDFADAKQPGWDAIVPPANPQSFAVDSLAAVTQKRIDFVTKIAGKAPAWWGRYVNNVTSAELDLLDANDIPRQPISHAGRAHTVLGDASAGQQDAQDDNAALTNVLGAHRTTEWIALDVEQAHRQ